MIEIEMEGGRIYAENWAALASLWAKIAQVTGAVGGIRETGKNRDAGYSYASYDDVVVPLKHALKDARLGLVYQVRNVAQSAEGKGILTKVEANVIVGDGDTGAFVISTVYGEAMDYGVADKGISKANTAAQKYALKRIFLLATADDDDDPDASDKPRADAEQPSTPRKPEAEQTPSAHWIDRTDTRQRFWAWARDQGLNNTQVHAVLGVSKMKEYGGSFDDARKAILEWIAQQSAPSAASDGQLF